MGFKRGLGKFGKWAGKAVLKEAGLIEGGSVTKLTEEVQEQIGEAVFNGVLQALLEYDRLAAGQKEEENHGVQIDEN